MSSFSYDPKTDGEATPRSLCRVRAEDLQGVPPSNKHLLVDPHECARVVGLALVLNAVEAVPPLAVVPLVVVVVLHLPHGFEHSQLGELVGKDVHG